MVFRQFLSEILILKKLFSALKFPLKATEYYTYNSVSSVKSAKLMTIIGVNCNIREEGQNAQLLTLIKL